MTTPKIAVTLTKVGVNMGDHAETYTVALDVDPSMSVTDLVESTLSKPQYFANPVEYEEDDFILIRVARPVVIPSSEPDTDEPF